MFTYSHKQGQDSQVLDRKDEAAITGLQDLGMNACMYHEWVDAWMDGWLDEEE